MESESGTFIPSTSNTARGFALNLAAVALHSAHRFPAAFSSSRIIAHFNFNSFPERVFLKREAITHIDDCNPMRHHNADSMIITRTQQGAQEHYGNRKLF
jgi:hypothetical protein